ncbi:hypothetical protein [Paracoccus fistulariae]|uniref:Uncharacterized protein n=1 Tax=Paracoccus fistulariae TaxID=658446 RepID=A0ABY7SJG6_9RHOB|nr:hypothetical protein [Paracoccus fistulariae]MDB6180624.1 hypothetical protein [Paracoccus fistulariae]WCR07139.1 hypothetical protein JHX87_17050 [Paracoccus fistulariae]
MVDFPRHLTKYFKWEDKKYLSNGSIRFGNTAEYRAAEDSMKLEARGDNKEGVQERYSFPCPTEPSEFRSPDYINARNAYFRDAPSGVTMSNNYHTSSINAWVFCASIGNYDEKHHRRMMDGDESTGYKGNPSLDGWCVFDTQALLTAVWQALPSHEKFFRHNPSAQTIYFREVDYSWEPKPFASAFEEVSAFFARPQLRDDEVVRQLTTKRQHFSTEREFRIIARIDERSSLPDHEPALVVASSDICRSIIGFGRVKQ